jgi:hypothetical protein
MRWISRLARAAVFIALLLAVPATAQGPEGYRKLSDKDAARELDLYAGCLVSRREKAARAVALAPFASPEQAELEKIVTRRIDDECLKGGFDDIRMTIRPDILAAAIAKQLLARDFPDLPSVVDRSTVDVEAERQRAAQLNVAERFGRCIVWNDPAGVQALLRADHGSAAERQAIAGLQQDMGMCVAEGNTLRLDRTFVRNIAAVSAYRLARQLRPAGHSQERG